LYLIAPARERSTFSQSPQWSVAEEIGVCFQSGFICWPELTQLSMIMLPAVGMFSLLLVSWKLGALSCVSTVPLLRIVDSSHCRQQHSKCT
jgi:hypothetical protein